MAHNNIIVFPTDFSERSLEGLAWARTMADALDAELHCIYVVEEPQIYATLDMGPVPIPSTEELARTAQSRLDQFIGDNLEKFDGKPRTAVRVGRPADEIVAYALEHNAKIVIMTTHGYSGLKHVLLGSTTEAVLRHASCPVLSIRTG